MKKKKALLITLLSSMALATAGFVVAASANGMEFLGSKAGTVIPGELSYSYSTTGHKAVTTYNHSFLKTTTSGTDIYFYSENNYSLQSKLVASFGSSSASSKFFTFTKDEDGTIPFVFQNVTSLTITSASTSHNGVSFSIYTSYSATTPSYSGTINAGEEKVITEVAGATYIKVVPTSTGFLDISNVKLNYSCDPDVEPGEKTLVGIRVPEFKKNYAVNSEFVEPTVYADYIQDGVPSSEVVEAEFSGYDMSATRVQTVTATFEDKSTTFDIHVKPTEVSVELHYHGVMSDFVTPTDFSGIDLYNSNFGPYVEPGETATFSVVMKEGYTFLMFYPDDSAVEIWDQIKNPSLPNQSFTMPSSGYSELDIYFIYAAPIVRIELEENPKTEYKVGSSFVEPTVYSVENNGSKVELTSGVTFTGFDSSVAVESQTITVSYPNVPDITYTISIVESPSYDIVGTYAYAYSSSITFKLQFNNDGTGKYYRWYNSTEQYTINFTYEKQAEKFVITIGSDYTRDQIALFTNGYRIVKVTTTEVVTRENASAEFDDDGNLKIDLWRYASSTHTSTNYTFERQ